MGKIVASAIGAAVLAFVTVGSAQAGKQSGTTPDRPAHGASQTTRAPYSPPGPDQGVSQSRPLFVVGGVPFVVWAPVAAPYNAKMNRTAAADSLWDVDAF